MGDPRYEQLTRPGGLACAKKIVANRAPLGLRRPQGPGVEARPAT